MSDVSKNIDQNNKIILKDRKRILKKEEKKKKIVVIQEMYDPLIPFENRDINNL